MENDPSGVCDSHGLVRAGVDRPGNCDLRQSPSAARDGAQPVFRISDGRGASQQHPFAYWR